MILLTHRVTFVLSASYSPLRTSTTFGLGLRLLSWAKRA